MSTDTTHVLTFTLGEETYCVDIEYVAEIVDGGELTSLPDAARHVEGVVDLRGRATTIVNPYEVLDIDGVAAGDALTDGGQVRNRIIVLDSDALGTDGATGWLVSDVESVTEVADETVETGGIADTDLLRGLIRGDDGFTIWLDPRELTA